MIDFDAPSLFCPCGHKSSARRVRVTCEGARFLTGLCAHCGSVVVHEFPELRAPTTAPGECPPWAFPPCDWRGGLDPPAPLLGR